MSLIGAAGPLHVHRNTMAYRPQRSEKILGSPVTDRALELQCALHLVEHYGAPVFARMVRNETVISASVMESRKCAAYFPSGDSR
ncbi:PucR C-terminal helix-turn-helix domain-containing protein [Prauserella aidingensis]|nr:PucR C-terminal helix-turn-helix domain-containing protein [Prauserella aidingensis]